MVEKYNEKVAGNPLVELVHVSFDQDEDAAAGWAAQEGFGWPTVMRDKIERSGLSEYAPRGSPHYLLVDGEGKKLAEGNGPVFAKLDELK